MISRGRIAAAAVVCGSGVVLLAAATLALETQDSLCAICHLPPEATYVARLAEPEPQDLAGAHARLKAPVGCIECHAGVGLDHRLRGLSLAIRDGAAFATGDYIVVGDEYAPLGLQSHLAAHDVCLDCHTDVLAAEEFEKHFHGRLDDPEAPEVACTLCHSAHLVRPATDRHMSDADTARGCDSCHAGMGGPSASLGR